MPDKITAVIEADSEVFQLLKRIDGVSITPLWRHEDVILREDLHVDRIPDECWKFNDRHSRAIRWGNARAGYD